MKAVVLVLACVLGVGCAGGSGAAPAPAAPEVVPPPSGSGCSDPVPLQLGRPVLGSTREGGRGLSASCAPSDSPESVFRLEVATRAQLRVVLNADFDAVLSLRDACSYADAELACNDDFPQGESAQSRLDVTLDPGEYFLIVDGAGGEAGDFELFASLVPLGSPRQACVEARSLAFDRTLRGSTRGLPDLFHATCGRGAHAGEHIYRFEVDAPSRLRVLQQTEYDGVLYLRSACATSASELTCNDDFRGATRSLLTARVDAGEYFLFTDGLTHSHRGTYSLRAELAPIEDDGAGEDRFRAICETALALPLEPGRAEVDTFTSPVLSRGSCGGADAPEAVFAFQVSEPSRVWVGLRDAEFNAVLYLRSRCDQVDSELACQEQASVDRRRRLGQPSRRGLNVLLDPGYHYLFVDGVGAGDFGAAQVELDVAPVAGLRDACEGAAPLRPGERVEARTERGPDRFRASCGGEARGPEHVYRLRIRERGTLTVSLEASFDSVLHLRRACADLRSEVACNDDATHDRHSRLQTPVEPGEYLLIVDGFRPVDAGPYRLRAELEAQPAGSPPSAP